MRPSSGRQAVALPLQEGLSPHGAIGARYTSFGGIRKNPAKAAGTAYAPTTRGTKLRVISGSHAVIAHAMIATLTPTTHPAGRFMNGRRNRIVSIESLCIVRVSPASVRRVMDSGVVETSRPLILREAPDCALLLNWRTCVRAPVGSSCTEFQSSNLVDCLASLEWAGFAIRNSSRLIHKNLQAPVRSAASAWPCPGAARCPISAPAPVTLETAGPRLGAPPTPNSIKHVMPTPSSVALGTARCNCP